MNIVGVLIVMSFFVIQVTTYGSAQSFGVMYLELLRVFNSSESDTSWIPSLYAGMMFAVGLPCSFLQRRFGIRPLAISGSIFLTGGLLSSAFVTSLFQLYITYGLVAGTGAGMLLFSGTCAINLYFNKRRQLACYLATSGLSVGSIFYPILLNFLIDKYGWRGTFVCVSGIASHTVAAAMLLKDKRGPEKSVVVKLCEQVNANKTYLEISVPEKDEPPNEKICKDIFNVSTIAYPTKGLELDDYLKQSIFLESDSKSGTIFHDPGKFSQQYIKFQNGYLNDLSKSKDELLSSKGKEQNIPQRSWLSDTRAIFSNVRYLIFTCGETYVVMLVYFIPFLYLPNLATSLGYSDSTAAFLITVAGISSLATRILNAVVSHKTKINIPLLNGIGLITGGAFTIACTFLHKELHLFLYAAYLGIFSAITSTIQSLVVRDIVGVELFSLAWGYTALISGIMAIVGPPLAGRIADISGGYSVTFQYAGGMFILAGFSSVIISVIKTCRRKTVSIN